LEVVLTTLTLPCEVW